MKSFLFIGAGRMGGALIKSLLEKGIKPSSISICEKNPSLIEEWSSKRIKVFNNPNDAFPCEIVVLAVKPQNINEALESIKDLPQETILCSIIAGITIEFIHNFFNKKVFVVRVMPNINALSFSAVNAISFSHNFPSDKKKKVKEFLSLSGKVIEIEEEKMNAVTALAGSGPAFVAEFISSLIEGGTRCGLTLEEAKSMTLQMISGSINTLITQDWTPDEMKKIVSSPGGTTIEGLSVMTAKGFKNIVIETIEAAFKKAIILGKKKFK